MQGTQTQVTEIAPAALALRPKASQRHPGRISIKYESADGGLQRYWTLAESHAGTGARRGSMLVETWLPEGRSFMLCDPDAPAGEQMDPVSPEEFEALLGGAVPQWDWPMAFSRINARRAGRIALAVADDVDSLNEVRAMAGLPPAPTLEEERQQMHDRARGRLRDLPHDARAYLFDPAWAAWAGGEYDFGMERGDILVFAPTERPHFPAGERVSEVDADGLREMRLHLFDPGDEAAAVWERLAVRLTPLTHDWHPGYVDPLAEFLAEPRHFRRKVSPVFVMSGGAA